MIARPSPLVRSDSSAPGPGRPGARMLVAAALLALGPALLVFGIEDQSPSVASTTPTVTVFSAESTPEPRAVVRATPPATTTTLAALETLVEGFPGGLSVMRHSGSGVDLIAWPPDEPAEVVPLPVPADTRLMFLRFSSALLGRAAGSFVPVGSFGAGGEHLAVTVPQANRPGFQLVAGPLDGPQPVADGVTSFVWHATDPSLLVYTFRVGDDAFVQRLDFSDAAAGSERLGPPEPVEAMARVVGWSEEGVQLQLPGSWRIVGEDTLTEGPGAVLAVVGGEVLYRDNGVFSTSLATGVTATVDELASSTVSVHAARDGRLLTEDVDGALQIIDLRNGDVVDVTARLAGAAAWTDDARYIVAPGFPGVVIIDSENGRVRSIGTGDVIAVAPSP